MNERIMQPLVELYVRTLLELDWAILRRRPLRPAARMLDVLSLVRRVTCKARLEALELRTDRGARACLGDLRHTDLPAMRRGEDLFVCET